ncbi:MAG: class I SAM-dependent methyltransferase [Gammaproteobacteria bacterium]|nr:class I SAM-dependent methyltransferase [Gammaproteobacteria bacterium]
MNPWSLFWRQGHSTTFGDYFKRGYEGAVADWWNSTLETLPANPVVMEVGCGNCSLLPAMITSRVGGKYIGVDLAQVEPSPLAREGLAASGIEVLLHPETPAEEIPEPDLSVDLVVSVFGIEYSDLDRSLPEVLRLLRPGRQFRALLHHDSSVVTSMSRRAISEYDSEDLATVIEALAVISAERDKAASIAELKASSQAEKHRKIINMLAEKYLSSTDPRTANATMFEIMTNALRFFKMMGADSEARRQFIASLQDEHTASHERFKQMVAVALDEEGIEAVQEKLTALGFSDTRTKVIYSNKDILGWELCTQK